MAEEVNYGGQAVIEGVMMRGKHRMAVAVRAPEGEIRLRTEPLNSAIYAGPLARIPILRGLTMLWDALGLGMKALMWSADVAEGEETNAFEGATGVGVVALGVGLAVVLFMLLPAVLVDLLPISSSGAVNSLLEGLVRLGIVIGYIWSVGRIPEIKRTFAYHGAEHKTINAYESGAQLTIDRVQTYPTDHPRCGTAFLLTVVALSIIVLAPLGDPPLLWRIASRLLTLPLIAGLSYELIRLSARYAERPWLRWLIRPNLALQRLTTEEPDEGMVEVAIRALKAVLPEGEESE